MITETEFKTLCESLPLTTIVSYVGEGTRRAWLHDAWSLAISWETNGAKDYARFDYRTGMGHRKDGIPKAPHFADIIESLILDSRDVACQSLKDWCETFGLDTDSRKARRTYKKCMKNYHALLRILGEETFDRLATALEEGA